MDNMLIQLMIVLCGFCVGSDLTKVNSSTLLSYNDTTDHSLLKLETFHNSKSKRDLGELNFNKNLFDSTFNANKINGLSYHDNNNLKVFIPLSSVKVTRNNSQSLGTYGHNFDSSNSPSENYRLNSQKILKSVKSKGIVHSNEDLDNLSHIHHTNTVYGNQALSSDSLVAQPEYFTTKSGLFLSNFKYNPQMKLQFDSYPALTEYSIPIYSAMSQIPAEAITSKRHHQVQQSTSQFAPHSTQLMQGLTSLHPISKTYAPLYRDNQQQQYQQHQLKTQFQNIVDNPYNNIQYTTSPTIEINGKNLVLPIFQLQTNHQFPTYIQALETTPVIFGIDTGRHFKTDPSLSTSFDFTNTKNIKMNQRVNIPFTTSLHNYRSGSTQILPVQSSSSTAQFPKFKGASIRQITNRGYSNVPNDYQDFKSQPQLHFDSIFNNQPNSYHKHAKPLEKIRTDVELINKNKSITPVSKDEGDDDSSEDDSVERHKSTDSYFTKDEDDDSNKVPRKYFKLYHLEGDFKPSKTFPFKKYDIKFSKQKKIPISISDDIDNYDSNVNLTAKYQYLAKLNNNDSDEHVNDEENESEETISQSKYIKYPVQKNVRIHSNNDDDDVEETSKQEKRDPINNSDKLHHVKISKSHKNREQNYTEKFDDESFRK